MKHPNPFDTKLDVSPALTEDRRSAFTEVTDTLDFCWAAAQAVFGQDARPEHGLALLPTFLQRADAARQQLRLAGAKQMARAAAPSAKSATAQARKRG